MTVNVSSAQTSKLSGQTFSTRGDKLDDIVEKYNKFLYQLKQFVDKYPSVNNVVEVKAGRPCRAAERAVREVINASCPSQSHGLQFTASNKKEARAVCKIVWAALKDSGVVENNNFVVKAEENKLGTFNCSVEVYGNVYPQRGYSFAYFLSNPSTRFYYYQLIPIVDRIID